MCSKGQSQIFRGADQNLSDASNFYLNFKNKTIFFKDRLCPAQVSIFFQNFDFNFVRKHELTQMLKTNQ